LITAHPATTTPAGIAEDIGRNLLVYGRRMPKAELFARIDAVDSATVKAVANRFFLDQDIAIAALGDTQVGGVGVGGVCRTGSLGFSGGEWQRNEVWVWPAWRWGSGEDTAAWGVQRPNFMQHQQLCVSEQDKCSKSAVLACPQHPR
jgi:hypothetical protein